MKSILSPVEKWAAEALRKYFPQVRLRKSPTNTAFVIFVKMSEFVILCVALISIRSTSTAAAFTVRSSQVPYLADTAGAMLDEIEANPDAVFLIEGHTDAVGSDVSNLTLSDRRAETVARILVEAYDVPAENLVTEGYGEQFLKVETRRRRTRKPPRDRSEISRRS